MKDIRLFRMFIEEAHKRNILGKSGLTISSRSGMTIVLSRCGWILTGYNGEDNFGGIF